MMQNDICLVGWFCSLAIVQKCLYYVCKTNFSAEKIHLFIQLMSEWILFLEGKRQGEDWYVPLM